MMLKTVATIILLLGVLALSQGATWGLPIILVSFVIFQTAAELYDQFNPLPKYNLAKLKGAWVETGKSKSKQRKRAARHAHAH